jgi:hypothetical protein
MIFGTLDFELAGTCCRTFNYFQINNRFQIDNRNGKLWIASLQTELISREPLVRFDNSAGEVTRTSVKVARHFYGRADCRNSFHVYIIP